MDMTPAEAKKMGYVIGATVIGGYLAGYYFGKTSEDCGCSQQQNESSASETGVHRGTVVSETFGSEMDQDMSGAKSDLSRLNPTTVEGAEDIMGAESFDSQYYNLNPLDYQTPTAFSEVSGYASQPFWDQANDMLPEYRFPMPWSAAYSPLSPYRPADYQQQAVTFRQTDSRVRPAVQNW